MLAGQPVYATLPAARLKRAVAWYSDKLGLTPAFEAGPVRLYVSGGTRFLVYRTEMAGTAKHTAATWLVNDLDGIMSGLRSRGVTFEEYDFGPEGPTTINGVSTSPEGIRTAWFRDSEDNVHQLAELPAGATLPG